MIGFVLARLREPSTLRGLILLASGLTGWQVDPDTAMQVVTLGLAVAGALGAATPDRPLPTTENRDGR